MTQYIIPTAALPDLVLSLLRGRLPLLSPLTTLTILLSFIGMVLGAHRVHRQQKTIQQSRNLSSEPTTGSPILPQSPQYSEEPQSSWNTVNTIGKAFSGTLYMTHWFIVIVSMTLRLSIRPKRLKWVKTVHHGASLPNPLPDSLD